MILPNTMQLVLLELVCFYLNILIGIDGIESDNIKNYLKVRQTFFIINLNYIFITLSLKL